MKKQRFLQQTIDTIQLKLILLKVQTPLRKAVGQIEARNKDEGLRKEVSDFLGGDVPPHFEAENPIFYLSRYLATPDYETLYYYKLVGPYSWPVVIGEDKTDKFTGQSSLKRNLMKLPIVEGVSKNGAGILKYENIADFSENQGKKISEISLRNGQPLISFHRKHRQLFK